MAHRQVGARFGEEQEQLRNVRRPEGYHRGELGLAVSCVDTFGEYSDLITEALELADLHWATFMRWRRKDSPPSWNATRS